MTCSPLDRQHMARALALARRGLNTTTPNPRVGCVIAHGARIVGEGWHRRAGEPHAEVLALRQAGEAARGATAYVTLEPCAHTGRTPPCADALIGAQVARVVLAQPDPNPQVAGKGAAKLRAAGIAVEAGLLQAEAWALNLGFFSRMVRARPWLRLKVAASLDGRTALANGESQWITGDAARRDGHRFRARACAVLTGIGTVLADNPRLDVRGIRCTRQPVRVIVDSRLRTPPDAALFAGAAPVWIAHVAGANAEAGARLQAAGAQLLALPANREGQVDLPALMQALAAREINEVHSEAGARLHGALLAAGMADEVLAYVAPVLLGDAARAACVLPQYATLAQVPRLHNAQWRAVGGDMRLLAQTATGAQFARGDYGQ